MDPIQQQARIDCEPPMATCDVCGHAHACYVGGAPAQAGDGGIRWQVHACLGCLMRAGKPGAIEAYTDCGTPDTASGGLQHA